MSLRLEQKVALITGGASGIGRATAIRFAEEGANLVIADRDLKNAEEVTREVHKLGRKAVTHQVDTSDEGQVDQMVEHAVSVFGGIDILVAAAGVSNARYGESGQAAQAPVSEKPFADWRKVLSINLDGVFLTDRAVARAMITAGNGGRIINIASGASKVPTPYFAEYAASKAAVWSLTKTLAVELGHYNITANAIGPGYINTPMLSDLSQKSSEFTVAVNRIPLRRVGEPRDVANTALFLASDEGSYYTGQILHPDGGVVMQ